MADKNTGIGLKIKMLREEKEISMDLMVFDLTNKYEIRIDKSMLSRWENGVNEPSLARAVVLAKYFDCSLDFLIGLTDDRTPARLRAYANKLNKRD